MTKKQWFLIRDDEGHYTIASKMFNSFEEADERRCYQKNSVFYTICETVCDFQGKTVIGKEPIKMEYLLPGKWNYPDPLPDGWSLFKMTPQELHEKYGSNLDLKNTVGDLSRWIMERDEALIIKTMAATNRNGLIRLRDAINKVLEE